jgi:glycosyltransferase involved in cell wall biosynthesis
MKAFVSINSGFGGAEKQFDQLVHDLRVSGITGEEWTYQRHDLSLMSRWQLMRALCRLRGGAVVYNMSVLGIGVLPLLVLKLMGNRILLFPHVVVSPARSRPKLWRVRAWLQGFSARLADRVVAISDGNLLTLERFIPREKLVVIYNYVACENNKPFEHRPLNRDIAIVGRLQDQHKQQLTFLRRHGDFLREHELVVHLFGSGPDEAAIRALIAAKGMEAHVVMHGWCDEIAIYAHPFSFVLNLSRWEGLPLSILEAIYRDRIVLLSDVDGNRELAYGDFLFNSDEELRELLMRVVVEQDVDEALLRAQKRRIYRRCHRDRALRLLGNALEEFTAGNAHRART